MLSEHTIAVKKKRMGDRRSKRNIFEDTAGPRVPGGELEEISLHAGREGGREGRRRESGGRENSGRAAGGHLDHQRVSVKN